MADKAGKHEFQVSLSGVELAPEHIEQINRAVQRAVLTELGGLNLEGSYGIRFPRPPIWGFILFPPQEFEEE